MSNKTKLSLKKKKQHQQMGLPKWCTSIDLYLKIHCIPSICVTIILVSLDLQSNFSAPVEEKKTHFIMCIYILYRWIVH